MKYRLRIISIGFALSLAILLLACSCASGKQAASVVVHKADGSTCTLSLSEDGQETFSSDLGWNTVAIQNGMACVMDADCPHQDCVHMGWISSPGQQAICLPHKFWIEISGKRSESDTVSR